MKDMEQLRRAAMRAGLMGSHSTQVPMHKLEAFASTLLDEENEACAVDADWCIQNHIEQHTPERIRARRKA